MQFAPPPGAADYFGEVIEFAAGVNPLSGFLVLNIDPPPDQKVILGSGTRPPDARRVAGIRLRIGRR